METPEDIDREIQALYNVVAEHKVKMNSREAQEKLRKTEEDVHLLEDSWNFAKEEQQHLFEETRRRYEADIYDLVARIKTIENKE